MPSCYGDPLQFPALRRCSRLVTNWENPNCSAAGSSRPLALLEPVTLSPLSPINEIDRWQMRCVAAAHACWRNDPSHSLQRRPADSWARLPVMKTFRVRECFGAIRAVQSRPRYTRAGGVYVCGLLQPGIVPAAAFLARAPELTDVQTVEQILQRWGLSEPRDGHRCAYLSCLPSLGVFARAGHLLHVVCPAAVDVHATFVFEGPDRFPERKRRRLETHTTRCRPTSSE